MDPLWDDLSAALAGLDPAAYLAIVVGLGAACQVLAWQLRFPSILLLLVVGFGLGQLADPEEVLGHDVLFGGVTIAVGIILFEGSLSLSFRQFREVGRPVVRLCSATVAIAWFLITLTAWLLGFDLEVALLVGAILVVTGPTVIGPILRMLRPTRRVSALLRWEGIVVDPIGAVLAVLVFQGVVAGNVENAFPALVISLLRTIVVAFVLAFVIGYLLEVLTLRHTIPDFLQGVAYLAGAIIAMVGSNALQPESGLLTVTVLGVYLGNRERLHLEHVMEFKEHLQVLFVGALFIVLAGRISPGQVWDVLPQSLVFVAVLVLMVRPVSVMVGLAGTGVTRQEKVLLAGMAPRGIVAAAVTSIFALELAHAADTATDDRRAADLRTLADQAEQMVPLVFLVIVFTVAVYGLGVGRLAERLGLASQKPQGVLFVGGQEWVVQAAKLLDESDIPVTVVARDRSALAGARMSGLRTVAANILSDYAVKDLDLAGIGRLIACTDGDEVNATAAREFAHVLGRANVYQLQRADGGVQHDRRAAAAHLTARIPFAPPLTHDDFEERRERGMRVKRTKLTEAFTLEHFRGQYGDSAVLLFVLDDGDLHVVTESTKVPEHGVSVIALVPETTAGPVDLA